MNISKHVALGAALILVGAAWAVRRTIETAPWKVGQADATPAIHHERGVVRSFTSSDLIISKTSKGKQQNTDFKLGPNTKEQRAIGDGEQVMVVYYQNQNHERIATEVKAESE